MDKQQLIKSLYDRYMEEFKGKEIVLGEGNYDAELLLIGEAPGKDEVKQGRPFVGMAGRNLSEFLGILGIDREAIYITNAIKFRLSKINPDSGRVVNRPAAKEEIEQNRAYLIEEIGIINPKYIITLGNVPLKSITGHSSISIGSVHGELSRIRIQENEYNLYPLYHPASIIYTKNLKEVYMNDMIRLRDILSKKES